MKKSRKLRHNILYGDDKKMGNVPGLTKTVSRIFFGTANPPVSTGDITAYDLLDSVLETGINAFDCARSYGKAEEILGKWIESRKCREKVIILTKCGDVKAGIVSVNRSVIMEQLNQSLESLRTDCIDIYLLHRDDPNTPVEEFIDTLNEAKEAGKIILCDRHTDSTVAYQGYGRGLDIERIRLLNNIATSGMKPDLTIVFDVDVETSMKRVGKNKDRMESAGVEFFNRVRQGYLEIAKKEPERVKVISSSDTIENIHKKVVELVEKL